jgi:translocation protein SEC66
VRLNICISFTSPTTLACAPPAKGTDPFFQRHVERDIYVTLLGMDPPAPDALLKAALIRRAVTDVHRILRIREDKPAIQQLLQKGLVGEDLWTSVLAAEKELEAEILEVQAEANTFSDGWGNWIFQSAGEMANSEKIHAVFKNVPKMRGELGTSSLFRAPCAWSRSVCAR